METGAICYLMSMRAVLATFGIVVLAGCVQRDSRSGWTEVPGSDPPGFGCHQDSDCAPNVCARNHSCLPADEVRPVTVSWTIGGIAADGTSCSANPDLSLRFYQGTGDWFGYSPVPCAEGRFFIDKLPTYFDSVELEVLHTGNWSSNPIDATGAVSFDLQ